MVVILHVYCVLLVLETPNILLCQPRLINVSSLLIHVCSFICIAMLLCHQLITLEFRKKNTVSHAKVHVACGLTYNVIRCLLRSSGQIKEFHGYCKRQLKE
jgi:hypothetical protein